MLAQRADEVCRKFFPFIHISADLADPAGLLLFYRLRLRLDMSEIVCIGDTLFVTEHSAFSNLSNEQRVGLELFFFDNLAADRWLNALRLRTRRTYPYPFRSGNQSA